jgi:hypothetical protein
MYLLTRHITVADRTEILTVPPVSWKVHFTDLLQKTLTALGVFSLLQIQTATFPSSLLYVVFISLYTILRESLPLLEKTLYRTLKVMS